MENNQQIWEFWADKLRHWGMLEFAASLLDATGPLNLLGAQLVYLGQPIFDQVLPAEHLNALAIMLENPEHTQAFTAFLRTQGSNKIGGTPQ